MPYHEAKGKSQRKGKAGCCPQASAEGKAEAKADMGGDKGGAAGKDMQEKEDKEKTIWQTEIRSFVFLQGC